MRSPPPPVQAGALGADVNDPAIGNMPAGEPGTRRPQAKIGFFPVEEIAFVEAADHIQDFAPNEEAGTVHPVDFDRAVGGTQLHRVPLQEPRDGGQQRYYDPAKAQRLARLAQDAGKAKTAGPPRAVLIYRKAADNPRIALFGHER